jgi:predicted HTH domain antitoxin
MEMQQIEVKFSLEVAHISQATRQQAEQKAREAYVMELLRQGEISSGRAARLLNMHRVDVLDLMGKYDISVFPDQTREELEREVKETMKMLEKYQQ